MPAWLWPVAPPRSTTLLVRIGRALHWTGVFAALLLLTRPLVATWIDGTASNFFDQFDGAPRSMWPAMIQAVVLAGSAYAAGRTLRYILADE